MRVGIPKEVAAGERRVSATPTTVAKLAKLGIEVLVQAGAGEGAEALDAQYMGVGATIAPDAEALYRDADLVLKVRPPQELSDGRHEVDLMKEGTRLLGFIWPGQNLPLVQRMAARQMTVLAMDAMPRITRAQSMDALSVFANIVGYRAVIEAAAQFGMFFPGQITAAGRVKPAQVMVIGAGVAGLAAIACARSLGAVVRAFDTRPSVREQIQSLGASFLTIELEESGEGGGGYAKEMSAEYIAAEQALIAANAKDVDVIISTAVVPGKPAPLLITSGAVVSMHRGSVIVDLAAEQGGNCALTERDKVVEKFGVKILGPTDLASRMARQASDLYAGAIYNVVADIFDTNKADVVLKLEDEIHRGIVVLDKGTLMWPPPTRPKPRSVAPPVEAKAPPPPPPPKPSAAGPIFVGAIAAALCAAGLFAHGDFLEHLTVFLLACVVGWHVVWNVTPALHTPLMSVTNAISGIILIGGVLLVGAAATGAFTALAAAAILLASINVAGGFLVTQRMLRMFRR
jgi:proton-translocating NAD(P)+ transhydrogenase subunit alpha